METSDGPFAGAAVRLERGDVVRSGAVLLTGTQGCRLLSAK